MICEWESLLNEIRLAHANFLLDDWFKHLGLCLQSWYCVGSIVDIWWALQINSKRLIYIEELCLLREKDLILVENKKVDIISIF